MAWKFFTSLGREKVKEVADTPTGLITSFAGGTAPTGWLLCDGSSVSTTTYSDLYSVIGTTYGAWTPNVSGYGVYASDNTITRVTGYGWDQSVYSTEGYGAGVYATAKAGATNLYSMFGLNTDPTTDASYSSIDYAWYFIGNGTLAIYENGSVVGAEGDYGAYTTSTVLRVQYDGTNVTYLKDGVVQRTVARASTTFYFDSSFFLNGLCLTSVDFGTITAANKKFKLPDLRGRIPVGTAAATGLGSTGTGTVTGGSSLAAQTLGSWAGGEAVQLSDTESAVKAHTHTVNATATHSHSINENQSHYHDNGGTLYGYPDHAGLGSGGPPKNATQYTGPNFSNTTSNGIGAGSTISGGNYSGKSGITINALAAAAATSSHPNMQPYIVTNFMIKT